MKSIDDINLKEAKGRNSYLMWRAEQGYDIRSKNEKDLYDYVNGLLAEIGDLESEVFRIKSKDT